MLKELIEKEQIDLVHTHGMLVNILGRLACWRAGRVKCISTTHLTRDLGGPPRVGGFLAGLKNKWYYRPPRQLDITILLSCRGRIASRKGRPRQAGLF